MADSSANSGAGGQDWAVLFARNPVAGRVKSRLWSRLSPEQACRLHCASTSDTAALLDRTLPEARKWLFFSEAPLPELPVSGLQVPPAFQCALQEGEDLGQRMGAAFQQAFRAGAHRVVIFGSDSPTLPPAVPPGAFAALGGADLVLGPTEDGGYYLIGCRRFDPELFRNVAWGTAHTLEQTRTNAERLGLRTATLETWFDIDEWQDVERLWAELRGGHPVPFHMAEFLSQLAGELRRAGPERPGERGGGDSV